MTIVLVMRSVVIIPQSETKIIERLGRYYATLNPGINVIIPFIDHAKEIVVMRNGKYGYTSNIDLREQVYDFDRQNVITKDNIQMQINALLYFQIVDPFKRVYEINNLPNAIEKLTQTTLRNIIGEMELDQALTSRDTINTKLRSVLDDATNKWGVKVNRVELQDITPPSSVGSDGYSWSSSPYNDSNGYNLDFNSGGVNPFNNNNRANGFSVRCVQE